MPNGADADRDLRTLRQLLAAATEGIDAEHFMLTHATLTGSTRRYRERVYCYELYHQLRRCWPPDFPYSLDGEPDKRNHQWFEGELSNVNPDLIIHRLGVMEHNLCAVEVKPASAKPYKLRADITGLKLLVSSFVDYGLGILLVYGGCRPAKLQNARTQCGARVEVWWHEAPGIPARPVG